MGAKASQQQPAKPANSSRGAHKTTKMSTPIQEKFTMFRADSNTFEIEPREVIAENSKTITYMYKLKSGAIVKQEIPRNTPYYSYFSTRENAILWLKEYAASQISHLETQVSELKEQLRKLD